jgi:hypothetical protein
MKKAHKDPGYRKIYETGREKMKLNVGWREQTKLRNQTQVRDPKYRTIMEKIWQNNIGIKRTEEECIKISMGQQGITERSEWPGYATEKRYCGLFSNELKERIRAYWRYMCGLTGEPESPERNLECHHVYWEKKSCCLYDEELERKYFIIKGEKYYYIGNPDKFIPLTVETHHTIAGNKTKSRIEWVKEIETLINNFPFNGKSFFTREEYWGNGYYHADENYERYYDVITGEIYGRDLNGWQGYGRPKVKKRNKPMIK